MPPMRRMLAELLMSAVALASAACTEDGNIYQQSDAGVRTADEDAELPADAERTPGRAATTRALAVLDRTPSDDFVVTSSDVVSFGSRSTVLARVENRSAVTRCRVTLSSGLLVDADGGVVGHLSDQIRGEMGTVTGRLVSGCLPPGGQGFITDSVERWDDRSVDEAVRLESVLSWSMDEVGQPGGRLELVEEPSVETAGDQVRVTGRVRNEGGLAIALAYTTVFVMLEDGDGHLADYGYDSIERGAVVGPGDERPFQAVFARPTAGVGPVYITLYWRDVDN